jgi:hypothetical protein
MHLFGMMLFVFDSSGGVVDRFGRVGGSFLASYYSSDIALFPSR